MGDSNLYNQQNPGHIFGDTGIYAVNLVANTDFGCSDETTKYLNINEQHSQVSVIMATVEKDEYILVEWSLLSVRTPMSYLLERSVDGIHFEFIDNFDGNTLEYLDRNVDVDKQSYTYRLMVIDSCEYENTYSNIGKSILLKVDHEKGYPHLSWSAYEKWSERVENYEIQFKDERTNTFSSISFVDDETFTYNDLETKAFLTQYTYRIVAHNKIEDIQTISNEVSIDTEFNIWIPNTFTPNGDGLNDLFKLTGTFISDFQISIFSKWGEKVFSSEDVEHSWDGTYRDADCQIGNYYYVIFVKAANGRSKKIDGNFVLLR